MRQADQRTTRPDTPTDGTPASKGGGRLSRRSLLRGAAVAGAAGLAGAATSAASATAGTRRSGVTTFVYVTGANGAVSGVGALGLRGHREVAVGLPGRSGQFHRSYQAPQDLRAFATEPSPMAGVTVDDYARATIEVVQEVAGYGPVILVGASMGGVTLNLVGNAIPDLIDRIVYETSFMCVELPSIAEYLMTPEGVSQATVRMIEAVQRDPAQVGDPARLGASRTNWRSANREFLAAVKGVMMADADETEFLAFLNTLQPDEALDPSTADCRVNADTWGRIPRTYIRHTRDQLLPVALQDRMIAEADRLTPRNRTDVRSVSAAHAPTDAEYLKVVDILDSLA